MLVRRAASWVVATMAASAMSSDDILRLPAMMGPDALRALGVCDSSVDLPVSIFDKGSGVGGDDDAAAIEAWAARDHAGVLQWNFFHVPKVESGAHALAVAWPSRIRKHVSCSCLHAAR